MRSSRLKQLLFVALIWFFLIPAFAQEVATNLWRLKISAFTGQSSPALAPDGTIYQGTFEGKLLAISPEGKVKWKFKAGREIKSSPAVADDGTIYFGSRDGNFYALGVDGKLKWKFFTGAWNDASPAVASDGTVYFGSWNKKFYAFTSDGKLKWQFATSNVIDSSPAIALDGTIYFGSHDQNFYALTPDGKLKWKFATNGEIESSPAIGADGTIYFSSLDGNFYALAPDGTERWRVHTGDYHGSSPVLDPDGNLFFAVNAGYICIGPDGKIRWQRGADWQIRESFAVTANDEIYVSYPWLRIAALDGHSGNPQWHFSSGSNLASSPNVGPDGVIYVNELYYLLAIQPLTNAAPLAKSSWPMWRANPQHTGRAQKWN
jgi:outer membrane protein assembly factor BamB